MSERQQTKKSKGNKKKVGESTKVVAEGAEAPPSGPVADILRETEVGLFILNHRTLVISFAVILILGLLGFGANKFYHQAQGEQLAAGSYTFAQGSLKELAEKKIDPAEFVKRFNALESKLVNSTNFTLTLINSVAELVRQKNHRAALSILEGQEWRGKAPANYGDYLIARWMVTIYEDLNEGQKAVDILESLNNAPFKVLEARNYLDLGRLYISLENYEKAVLNLDYLIQNFPNDQLGKVAKIYLEQINK